MGYCLVWRSKLACKVSACLLCLCVTHEIMMLSSTSDKTGWASNKGKTESRGCSAGCRFGRKIWAYGKKKMEHAGTMVQPMVRRN